ncbi:hypothetical protein ACRRTK_014501 [Alexandromys fortis]
MGMCFNTLDQKRPPMRRYLSRAKRIHTEPPGPLARVGGRWVSAEKVNEDGDAASQRLTRPAQPRAQPAGSMDAPRALAAKPPSGIVLIRCPSVSGHLATFVD